MKNILSLKLLFLFLLASMVYPASSKGAVCKDGEKGRKVSTKNLEKYEKMN
jgi:hypothetical protein